METKQMYLSQGHPNRPGTVMDKVTGVVVHWTANESAGADAVANRNYFNREWKGTLASPKEVDGSNFRWASAHLNVDDHQLVECLPWKKGAAEVGYHVGGNYVPGICDKLGTTYPNNRTIGLEICVNSDGNFAQAYANGVQVIAAMLAEHGLGLDSLIRHYDVTGKLCPGFFTQDSYAQKYLGMNAGDAYAKFRADVQAALAPAPQYFKVYQQGVLYKYQFATSDGAEGCAKWLFRNSGGKDNTIYVTDPAGNPTYTPAKHPEDFPEYNPQYFKVYMQGAIYKYQFGTADGAVGCAKWLFESSNGQDATIYATDPQGNLIYTPSKHPEDFAFGRHPIMGSSAITVEQMKQYIADTVPAAPAGIAETYFGIATKEGIKPEIAFAQALWETGRFQFGGDVKREQNNFCGLGATGGGNPGASFPSITQGVTAHVQHLKAYASTDALVLPKTDPRFDYVTRGQSPHIEDLGGKWAVPGYDTKAYASFGDAYTAGTTYGQNINKLAEAIAATVVRVPAWQAGIDAMDADTQKAVYTYLKNKLGL